MDESKKIDKLNKQDEFWKGIINKYENRNADLEREQMYLQQRVNQMEGSAPAAMAFSMAKLANDKPNADVKSVIKIPPVEPKQPPKPLKLPDFSNMSVFSIDDADVLYMDRIKLLTNQERKLIDEVNKLRTKEKALNDTKKRVDSVAGRPTGERMMVDGSDLSRMNQKLMEENRRLSDEIEDLKLQMKHDKETLAGPLTRELEREKRRAAQLENELQRIELDVGKSRESSNKEFDFLKDQLLAAKQNLQDMNHINDKLKDEINLLNHKTEELQNDLINQKLSEANTLALLKSKLDKQEAGGPCRCQPGYPPDGPPRPPSGGPSGGPSAPPPGPPSGGSTLPPPDEPPESGGAPYDKKPSSSPAVKAKEDNSEEPIEGLDINILTEIPEKEIQHDEPEDNPKEPEEVLQDRLETKDLTEVPEKDETEKSPKEAKEPLEDTLEAKKLTEGPEKEIRYDEPEERLNKPEEGLEVTLDANNLIEVPDKEIHYVQKGSEATLDANNLIEVPDKEVHDVQKVLEDTLDANNLIEVPDKEIYGVQKGLEDTLDANNLIEAPDKEIHHVQKRSAPTLDANNLIEVPDKEIHDVQKGLEDSLDANNLIEVPDKEIHDVQKVLEDTLEANNLIEVPDKEIYGVQKGLEDTLDANNLIEVSDKQIHDVQKGSEAKLDANNLIEVPDKKIHDVKKGLEDTLDANNLIEVPDKEIHEAQKGLEDKSEANNLIEVPDKEIYDVQKGLEDTLDASNLIEVPDKEIHDVQKVESRYPEEGLGDKLDATNLSEVLEKTSDVDKKEEPEEPEEVLGETLIKINLDEVPEKEIPDEVELRTQTYSEPVIKATDSSCICEVDCICETPTSSSSKHSVDKEKPKESLKSIPSKPTESVCVCEVTCVCVTPELSASTHSDGKETPKELLKSLSSKPTDPSCVCDVTCVCVTPKSSSSMHSHDKEQIKEPSLKKSNSKKSSKRSEEQTEHQKTDSTENTAAINKTDSKSVKPDTPEFEKETFYIIEPIEELEFEDKEPESKQSVQKKGVSVEEVAKKEIIDLTESEILEPDSNKINKEPTEQFVTFDNEEYNKDIVEEAYLQPKLDQEKIEEKPAVLKLDRALQAVTSVKVLKKTNGMNTTTTITRSGGIEVKTEGPDGTIDTTLTITKSGNVEVITEYTDLKSEMAKCKCEVPVSRKSCAFFREGAVKDDPGGETEKPHEIKNLEALNRGETFEKSVQNNIVISSEGFIVSQDEDEDMTDFDKVLDETLESTAALTLKADISKAESLDAITLGQTMETSLDVKTAIFSTDLILPDMEPIERDITKADFDILVDEALEPSASITRIAEKNLIKEDSGSVKLKYKETEIYTNKSERDANISVTTISFNEDDIQIVINEAESTSILKVEKDPENINEVVGTRELYTESEYETIEEEMATEGEIETIIIGDSDWKTSEDESKSMDSSEAEEEVILLIQHDEDESNQEVIITADIQNGLAYYNKNLEQLEQPVRIPCSCKIKKIDKLQKTSTEGSKLHNLQQSPTTPMEVQVQDNDKDSKYDIAVEVENLLTLAEKQIAIKQNQTSTKFEELEQPQSTTEFNDGDFEYAEGEAKKYRKLPKEQDKLEQPPLVPQTPLVPLIPQMKSQGKENKVESAEDMLPKEGHIKETAALRDLKQPQPTAVRCVCKKKKREKEVADGLEYPLEIEEQMLPEQDLQIEETPTPALLVKVEESQLTSVPCSCKKNKKKDKKEKAKDKKEDESDAGGSEYAIEVELDVGPDLPEQDLQIEETPTPALLVKVEESQLTSVPCSCKKNKKKDKKEKAKDKKEDESDAGGSEYAIEVELDVGPDFDIDDFNESDLQELTDQIPIEIREAIAAAKEVEVYELEDSQEEFEEDSELVDIEKYKKEIENMQKLILETKAGDDDFIRNLLNDMIVEVDEEEDEREKEVEEERDFTIFPEDEVELQKSIEISKESSASSIIEAPESLRSSMEDVKYAIDDYVSEMSKSSGELISVQGEEITELLQECTPETSWHDALETAHETTEDIVEVDESEKSMLSEDSELKIQAFIISDHEKVYKDMESVQSKISGIETEQSSIRSDEGSKREHYIKHKGGVKMEETSVKSKVSSIKIEEASVKSKVSSFKIEDASVKSKVSSYKMEEASVKSKVSSYKMEEASVKSKVSSFKMEEASVKSKVSSYKMEEASVKLKDSSYIMEEASVKSKASSFKTEEASVKSKVSSYKMEEASVKSKDSSYKMEEASIKSKVSSHKMEEASVNAKVSSTTEGAVSAEKRIFKEDGDVSLKTESIKSEVSSFKSGHFTPRISSIKSDRSIVKSDQIKLDQVAAISEQSIRSDQVGVILAEVSSRSTHSAVEYDHVSIKSAPESITSEHPSEKEAWEALIDFVVDAISGDEVELKSPTEDTSSKIAPSSKITSSTEEQEDKSKVTQVSSISVTQVGQSITQMREVEGIVYECTIHPSTCCCIDCISTLPVITERGEEIPAGGDIGKAKDRKMNSEGACTCTGDIPCPICKGKKYQKENLKAKIKQLASKKEKSSATKVKIIVYPAECQCKQEPCIPTCQKYKKPPKEDKEISDQKSEKPLPEDEKRTESYKSCKAHLCDCSPTCTCSECVVKTSKKIAEDTVPEVSKSNLKLTDPTCVCQAPCTCVTPTAEKLPKMSCICQGPCKCVAPKATLSKPLDSLPEENLSQRKEGSIKQSIPKKTSLDKFHDSSVCVPECPGSEQNVSKPASNVKPCISKGSCTCVPSCICSNCLWKKRSKPVISDKEVELKVTSFEDCICNDPCISECPGRPQRKNKPIRCTCTGPCLSDCENKHVTEDSDSYVCSCTGSTCIPICKGNHRPQTTTHKPQSKAEDEKKPAEDVIKECTGRPSCTCSICLFEVPTKKSSIDFKCSKGTSGSAKPNVSELVKIKSETATPNVNEYVEVTSGSTPENVTEYIQQDFPLSEKQTEDPNFAKNAEELESLSKKQTEDPNFAKNAEELESLMTKIKCACREAESITGPVLKKTASEFTDTLAGLQEALDILQQKCLTKDMMIDVMKEELKLKAHGKVFEDLLNDMTKENENVQDYEFSNLSKMLNKDQPSFKQLPCICETEPDGKDIPCECTVNPIPLEITDMKRIGPISLLIKWRAPTDKKVFGYEIVVDNVVKSKIFSNTRTSAVLDGIKFKGIIKIEIFAVSVNGRCLPPATAEYRM